MYRFLVSPRWIGLAVFTVVMTLLFIWLGGWQADRYEQRKDSNALIRSNYTAEPVPIEEALADGWTEDSAWKTVNATGTFDPENEVTVRFAQRDSQPGVEIVTAFRLASGDLVLVNRGWVKSDNTGAAPDDIPPAPTGTMTITGWLQPDSSADATATTPTDGQVRAIDSKQWTKTLGEEPLPGYVAMTAPEQTGVELAQQPDLGSGPSLFYSIQWYFFTGLAVFGYFWFVRAEVLERRKKKAAASV